MSTQSTNKETPSTFSNVGQVYIGQRIVCAWKYRPEHWGKKGHVIDIRGMDVRVKWDPGQEVEGWDLFACYYLGPDPLLTVDEVLNEYTID